MCVCVLLFCLGAVSHLYFDIEFKIAVNPGVKAIPALETFIEVISHIL